MSVEKPVRSRFIRKPVGYLYADISIEFETKQVSMDERSLKLQLLISLKSIFGDHGASIPIDILKFSPKQHRVYIRFHPRHLVHVRTALTLTRSFEERRCVILIHKICHSLSSLPLEQSNFKHNVIRTN